MCLMCLYVPHGPVHTKTDKPSQVPWPPPPSLHLMYPNVVWLMECDECLNVWEKITSCGVDIDFFCCGKCVFYVVNF